MPADAALIVAAAYAVLAVAAYMTGQRAARALIAWADRVRPR